MRGNLWEWKMNNLFKALVILLATCTPALALPILDIEKTTNGPTNSNPTAPDYDNEDTAGGAGVPVLTPGSVVTWTYKVTNIGDVPFSFSFLVITDDNGTPGNAADDLTTTGGQITFLSVQTGDADNLLEPGEVWLYRALDLVQNVAVYENAATVATPNAPGTQGDSDLSHYATPRAVPLPATFALFAIGGAAACLARRRNRKR